MATESSAIHKPQRYAVVTGANKGIGFEICRQLSSEGITVILTARIQERGMEALEKLKASGLSDYLIFHQLDVGDASCIVSLAQFVKTQFGRLDILVNNAGILGVIMNNDVVNDWSLQAGHEHNWAKATIHNHELAEECVKMNYYGAKMVIEEFIPLLQLSDSPRIVNVSSTCGKLKLITNGWAKSILNDAENLNEERIDEVLNEFLKDSKNGLLEAKNLAFWNVCVRNIKSCHERLHEDYRKEILEFSCQFCVSWIYDNRLDLPYGIFNCRRRC